MRRANAQLQSDRRAEILGAAERCFSGAGFHQTSMQKICAEAGMSPGNLYRYFASKEAIIAGICERNRAEAADSFAALDKAADFFDGLAGLARHYLVERTAEEVGLCAEIMAESRRNPDIANLYQGVERDVKARIAAMLRSAAERGEISPEIDPEGVASVLMVLGDGMSWRRAVDPDFNAEVALPLILAMVQSLLAARPAQAQTPEEMP